MRIVMNSVIVVFEGVQHFYRCIPRYKLGNRYLLMPTLSQPEDVGTNSFDSRLCSLDIMVVNTRFQMHSVFIPNNR